MSHHKWQSWHSDPGLCNNQGIFFYSCFSKSSCYYLQDMTLVSLFLLQAVESKQSLVCLSSMRWSKDLLNLSPKTLRHSHERRKGLCEKVWVENLLRLQEPVAGTKDEKPN